MCALVHCTHIPPLHRDKVPTRLCVHMAFHPPVDNSSTRQGASVRVSVGVTFLLMLLPVVETLSLVAPVSRRNAIMAGISFTVCATPAVASAAPDCITDCLKNCNLIAPKDPEYCLSNCRSYCDQPSRSDGLSGSSNSDTGETGILGLATVVKGEDKPPQVKLPGLDFTVGAGKKLIGY